MRSRNTQNTLERKIYFFRAQAGIDDTGRPLAFDPLPALKDIDAIDFIDDDSGRYLFDGDGNALCVFIHSLSPNPCMRFCRVRRTGLPQLEQAGQISDLNLDPNSGLLEAIHVVFFPNNIVGAEYNHFGPRISSLGGYLQSKSGQSEPKASFSPLLRRDASEQLDRLEEIRLLEFGIRPAFIETVRSADASLADGFAANIGVFSDPETVQLIVKPTKESRGAALERFLMPVKRILAGDGLFQNADRFQIRGKCADTGLVETVDLLRDQFISTKRIVRMSHRSRALVPESAFEAVQDAHGELRENLERASSIL